LHLLVTERCKKKFKNRLWKSRACVPLRSKLWSCCFRYFIGRESGRSAVLTTWRIFTTTISEAPNKPNIPAIWKLSYLPHDLEMYNDMS
jgi:hypothetical protein